ncbi:MAG: hypothetical protein WBG86_03540 [Polyangiales bacterium]
MTTPAPPQTLGALGRHASRVYPSVVRTTGIGFVVAMALSACVSSQAPGGNSTIGAHVDIETMQPHEAAQIVEDFAAKYGIELPLDVTTEITSMAQVLDLIRADRLSEYEAARRFTAGKHGAEALTVRAYLELSQGGAMLTTAAILEEERTQAMTELRQLTGPSAYRGASREPSKGDPARTENLRMRTEDLRKVVRALELLSKEPIAVGADFAKQAIRHDPKSQLAYLARANAFRLQGDWLEFDRMMQYADDLEGNPPIRTYLLAMEAFERYADSAKCGELLRATLTREPHFVRAQANLVLVSKDVGQRHEELQRLESQSPHHIVVRLAGPMIESEYQTVKELDEALDGGDPR